MRVAFENILGLPLAPFGIRKKKQYDDVECGEVQFSPDIAFKIGSYAYEDERGEDRRYFRLYWINNDDDEYLLISDYVFLLDKDNNILDQKDWNQRRDGDDVYEMLYHKFDYNILRRAKKMILASVELRYNKPNYEEDKFQDKDYIGRFMKLSYIIFDEEIIEAFKKVNPFEDLYISSNDQYMGKVGANDRLLMFGMITELAILANKKICFDGGLDKVFRKSLEKSFVRKVKDTFIISRGSYYGGEYFQLENGKASLSIGLPEKQVEDYNQLDVFGYSGKMPDIRALVYESVDWWSENGKIEIEKFSDSL